ncbi:MAG TPA: serine hydrolase [Gemmatimonadales bacterium]|nr:serine hydrolase [Gemmatimonadales bacterium]
MRNLCLVTALAALAPLGLTAQIASLERELQARIQQDTAEVAVAYLDPVTRDTLFINGLRRYHAASTMKLPVLIELARRVDMGELRWDSPLTVHNEFQSIVDGSSYRLDPADDADSSLYDEEGHSIALSRLARLMIARSSNLATNLVVDRLGAARINATAHALGADSISVLRGVEDGKAFAAGLNNTTTARDLALLLDAIAGRRAASPAQCDVMVGDLLAQEFNDGIPAGLPAGTRVAHKTGDITAVAHDAAIVYPTGRRPYVLVILTRGYGERANAARLMADLSRLVYNWATRRPDPHE